ncbi:MAG TPA: GtrA family protein, partial [Parvularculaceae bacterium]|nr:GtrA family protein [Parvularculaceae bacterium]
MRSAKVALRAHGSRFARFSIIGAIAGAADFTVYLSLVAFGAPPVVANFPAFVASTVTSYNLNARITFRRNGAPAPVSLSGYARYFSAYVFSLIVSTAIIGFFAGPIGAVPA